MTENNFEDKAELLSQELKTLGKVAVAFSGGVDSSFLLKIAVDTLGKDVIAVLAIGAIHPKHETEKARKFARDLGVEIVEIKNLIDQDFRFAKSPPDRCYLCKRALLNAVIRKTKELGFDHIVEGSNIDDQGDYRPGKKAVLELGVKSPLLKAGFTKAQIRQASKAMNLQTWDQASGACLASRFPYGARLDRTLLAQVEQAEEILREAGFFQLRVRHHGNIARIEVPAEEIARFASDDLRALVTKKIKALGFSFVALDLSGYRTGSMNAVLKKPDSEKK